MKLLQLINAENALSHLGNAKGLSSVTAYRISKNIKTIFEEIKSYNDTRTKICIEYADKDNDGKPVIKNNRYCISRENEIKLNEELSKLLNEDADINIKKVTLEDIDKVGLSPLELDSIEFMIDLKEER